MLSKGTKKGLGCDKGRKGLAGWLCWHSGTIGSDRRENSHYVTDSQLRSAAFHSQPIVNTISRSAASIINFKQFPPLFSGKVEHL